MDADVTDSAESQVERNLNWNFSVNVLDNMFYALAISLVSQETIMPLLVSELTDSTIAVGLIPAIFSLSFLLPQLFVANHAERLPRKLPFVLLGSGLLQRLPYPLIGLALLLFAVEAPAFALLLFFIGIATAAFGGGIVTPAWFTMIGKVIPTRRRGIFFGLADGGGLLMGVVGAYFVGRVLELESSTIRAASPCSSWSRASFMRFPGFRSHSRASRRAISSKRRFRCGITFGDCRQFCAIIAIFAAFSSAMRCCA